MDTGPERGEGRRRPPRPGPSPAGPRAFAPGRVNLIGDHTDYNGGLALPMAIGLGTTVTVQPADSPRLTLVSDEEPGTTVLERTPVARGDASWTPAGHRTPPWGGLAGAVVRAVSPWRGGTVQITSTLPLGAGLSSSASLCTALAMALGARGTPLQLARLCQRAEADAGAEVGLLDPWAIAGASEGHALLLDFTSLSSSAVPVPPEAALTVIHSGQRRALGGSPYAERRRQCGEAAAILGAPLGSLGPGDLGGLGRLGDPVLARRARHVVTECARVRSFVDALVAGDRAAAGGLMDESHRSLAGDFEASTVAVDQLVERVRTRAGVLGARMTGGGFGGCVVALSEPGALDPARWKGAAWAVSPCPGAAVLP